MVETAGPGHTWVDRHTQMTVMTMAITNEAELEQAMQEFNKLRDAPDGSPEAARREELDAEIKAWHARIPSKGMPGRY